MPDYQVAGPKGGAIIKRAPLARVRKVLPALVKRFARVTVKRAAPAPKLAEFVMYDSITPSEIPSGAGAVAGYVNGRWPTFAGLAKSHPHARRLSIAVTAAADAECLDVELGDATPAQAAAWVKRQHARGVSRPAVYASISEMAKVRATLRAAGIRRDQVREWTAHYTFKPHRCTAACGFGYTGVADATQYHDKALGRDLDASLCAPDFL